MTRIVLLGAPGSGKGTQAQRLEALFALPQVSSGDLLRDAVARGTDLGIKARAAMDAGKLVSDDIVLGLIRERLSQADTRRGFILDGYPRNTEQAGSLERLLDELGQPLDGVVLLDVSRDLLQQRLAGRRTCRTCGRVFNIHLSPPGTPPHCDRCDDRPELFQRPDDREEVIEKRLAVYEEQTRPLIDHYARKGLLQIVKGEGPLEEVFGRMQSVLLGAGATVPPVRAQHARAKGNATTGSSKARKTGAGKSARTKTGRKNHGTGTRSRAASKARTTTRKKAKSAPRKTAASARPAKRRSAADKQSRHKRPARKRPASKRPAKKK